jgi:hypothetical protein
MLEKKYRKGQLIFLKDDTPARIESINYEDETVALSYFSFFCPYTKKWREVFELKDPKVFNEWELN